MMSSPSLFSASRKIARQHRSAEKSACTRQSCLCVLDRRSPRRLELLLQTPRAKDHENRMESARCNSARLCTRSRKSMNPVAPMGRGSAPRPRQIEPIVCHGQLRSGYYSGDTAMTVETILRHKGTEVSTIEPEASLRK